MGGTRHTGHRAGVVLAAGVVTVGLVFVAGVTALAYARNPDLPDLPSQRQDLVDGLVVAALGWLTCLGLLGYAMLRRGNSADEPRAVPPVQVLVAAVGLGLVGSVLDLAGQTAASDRLSLVLWSDSFYIVGAVCLGWTLSVVFECGVLGPDADTEALHGPRMAHPHR